MNTQDHYILATRHFPHVGYNQRVTFVGICNKPGAELNDGVWFDTKSSDIEYKEYPAGSQKQFTADIELSHLNYDKYPDFGISCPCCEFSQNAREQWLSYQKDSQSRGEKILRQILNEVYGKSFPNVRPNWLLNPRTGKCLELDCYSEELKLAFEYQGIQHYEPVGFWGGKKSYEEQIKRDEIKKRICKDKGIVLIQIDSRAFPYNKKSKLKNYIKKFKKTG